MLCILTEVGLYRHMHLSKKDSNCLCHIYFIIKLHVNKNLVKTIKKKTQIQELLIQMASNIFFKKESKIRQIKTKNLEGNLIPEICSF